MSKQERVRALLARNIDWPCPIKGVEFIANEEDCRLVAYDDATGRTTGPLRGVATCGWGETDGVVLGMVWTQEVADGRLLHSLRKWCAAIDDALDGVGASENEYVAMLSFSYNIGIRAFRKSTMLRLHKAGDRAGAARAFHLLNKSRRKGFLDVDDVLVGRRARESAIYMTPDDYPEAPAQNPMPQSVEPESNLAKSPINVGGVIGVSSGALALGKESLDKISEMASTVSGTATSLQVSPIVVLGLVLLTVGATSMYWRWKQRQGGWA